MGSQSQEVNSVYLNLAAILLEMGSHLWNQ